MSRDLWIAAKADDFENVKTIVMANPDVNLVQNYEEHTPLDWAIVNKNREMAKFLMSKGAPIHLKSKDIFYLQVKEQFKKEQKQDESGNNPGKTEEDKERDRELRQLKNQIQDLQAQVHVLQGTVQGLHQKIEKMEEDRGSIIQLQQKLTRLEEKNEKK